MNRGILESLPVQQLMTGNPNWWSNNISTMHPPTHHHQQQQSPFLLSSSSTTTHPSLFPPHQLYPHLPSSSSLPINSWSLDTTQEQQLPESWSQLLLGGSVGEEDERSAQLNHYHQQVKKLEKWEQDQILFPSPSNNVSAVDVKQEVSEGAYIYSSTLGSNEEFQPANPNWSNHHHQVMPVSSPKSCVTSFSSNNMLDFSNKKADGRHHQLDLSSECNSTATGGAFKKARVQQSSTQSTFKVRKEKLGDRITTLHQLVSPFGKTDTASVLLEVIGYIRFLQSQIEALSSPYMGSSRPGNIRQQQCVQGDQNSIFPEDPGQLLNDTSIKRRGIRDEGRANEAKTDLRSRGLCLVPVSCTLQVGSENGADYWAPTLGGGFR